MNASVPNAIRSIAKKENVYNEISKKLNQQKIRLYMEVEEKPITTESELFKKNSFGSSDIH